MQSVNNSVDGSIKQQQTENWVENGGDYGDAEVTVGATDSARNARTASSSVHHHDRHFSALLLSAAAAAATVDETRARPGPLLQSALRIPSSRTRAFLAQTE